MASGKKGPAFKIHESIQELLVGSGKLNDKDIVQLLRELPRKWERHGDLIIIPHDALRSECWKNLGLYLEVHNLKMFKILLYFSYVIQVRSLIFESAKS